MGQHTLRYRIVLLAAFAAFQLRAQETAPKVADRPFVSRAALTKRVDPQYPARAKKAGLQGTVLLRIIILADGSATGIRVVRSLDPDLDEQAVLALQKCRFQPAILDWQPVASEAKVKVDFRLTEDHGGPVVLDFSDPEPANAPACLHQWKEGAPHCAKFANSGVVVKSIEAGDLAVYVSLSEMGDLVRAYFMARNRSGEYSYKVDPAQASLEHDGIPGKAKALNPREFLAAAGTHSKVDRALAGTPGAVAEPVLVSGPDDGTVSYAKDIDDIRIVNRQIAELNRAGRTYKERLADYLVFAEPLGTLNMSFGAIYFVTGRQTGAAVFAIPIEFGRVVDGGPFRFEFAFQRAEIERQ